MTVHSNHPGSFSMEERKAGRERGMKRRGRRKTLSSFSTVAPGLLLLSPPSNAVPLNSFPIYIIPTVHQRHKVQIHPHLLRENVPGHLDSQHPVKSPVVE